MDLRPALQLHTVIKALTDVVLPAVDPHNKPAQEQAWLAIGMLHLVAQRQPLLYRYERDELARFLVLADTLREQAAALPVAKAALHALTLSTEAGEDVLERAQAEPSELEAANFDLREKIGALITTVYAGTPTSDLKPISAAVNAHAKAQLLRERVWLQAQGWEPDPTSLPAIEALIGDGPDA